MNYSCGLEAFLAFRNIHCICLMMSWKTRKNLFCFCISGLKEAMGASGGQWVYVSDAHVQMVPESRVLNAQAYLLFYERLLL